VVANGREYELDCLIFGTGFETATDYTHKVGFEVRGREGLSADREVEGWRGHLSRSVRARLSRTCR
jgi:hypothetical protein